jgi:nucleoside-diphosphate-sugar epimerase
LDSDVPATEPSLKQDLPGRIVVTGETGFVGRRLTARLNALGVEVAGFSRSTGGDLLTGDLPLDGAGHVFHLGALSFVPDSWTDPANYHLVNTHGTVRVLDQCRRAGVPLTFISTFVYGAGAPVPVSEDFPPAPANPYAWSKLAAEDACRFFAKTFGMDVTVLRLFNAYGPGQKDSFLIPTIARQAVDPSVKEIVVADLAPRRDFVHVDDVVDAMISTIGMPGGGTYNVGSGRSYSIGDVIAACLKAAGADKPYSDRGERRENEVMDVVADISALTAATSWRPQVGFEQGMKTVIEAQAKC